MTGITLYGISNCDQVRKARRLLGDHKRDYHFHDFRRDGLTGEMLDAWFSHVPWDALINKRGTTWRTMAADARAAVVDQRSAREAMLAEPTLIRRPVLTVDDHVLVGFSEAVYQRTLGLDPAQT